MSEDETTTPAEEPAETDPGTDGDDQEAAVLPEPAEDDGA